MPPFAQDEHTAFPYDEVGAALGDEAAPDSRDEAYGIAARFTELFLRWLILGPEDRPDALGRGPCIPMIAKRAIAASWVINPGLLGGESLRSLAAKTGTNKSDLSELAVKFGDRFGMHGRGQRTASVRLGYAARRQSVNRQVATPPPQAAQGRRRGHGQAITAYGQYVFPFIHEIAA